MLHTYGMFHITSNYEEELVGVSEVDKWMSSSNTASPDQVYLQAGIEWKNLFVTSKW